ncbi:MAG: DUF4344 domain-containing metallopeptidase [Rhizobiaceae bacterium]
MFLRVAIISLMLFTSSSAIAELLPNRIEINYEQAKNPDHAELYDLLRERQALEKIQKFLSPFKLPRPLVVRLKGCDGEADAYYGDDVITICYEYLVELWKGIPDNTTPAGITPVDAIVGPFVDTTLHEFAHALIDMFQMPVLGRLEDAADQIAAYIYLRLDESQTRRLIMGTVYTYFLAESRVQENLSVTHYADEHGTPAQRAYNLLCMAYGANISKYGDIVSKGYLPQKRAIFCEEEYEQVQDALDILLLPYVDRALAKEVRSTNWLKQVDDLLDSNTQ